ncbi:FapA family protein [Saccharibacillus sacchari]|uniref:FapA family protein n=1 Tax=Saccharibacillus sacchari TaxID=456493 RepID=A0ACC6P936_9BACL
MPYSAPEKENATESTAAGGASGSSESRPAPADGSIEVNGGAVRVVDPGEDGAYALLVPLPPLRLWLNGVELSAASPVRASDRIEWEQADEPLYEIAVSPDRMSADIRVFAEVGYAWTLQNHPPAAKLSPQAIPDRDKPPVRKLEIAEIMAEVGKLGIRKNLDVPAVVQALQDADGMPVRFAVGLAPEAGTDAELELFFGEKIENAFEEIAGALDYRNHLRIPSVQPGDVLARLIPSRPGTPGYDVYGETIEPPPVREIDLRARQHVEACGDGMFVATKAGRPCIADGPVRYLDISDAYVVAGDVDLKTGHIVFSGDVAIHGSVTDNMIVESLGNVYVSGGVYHSTITAAGSIIVQGSVIGSRLYSGSFGLSFNRLYHLSQQLTSEIGMLLQASRTLYEEVGKRGQSARFGQVALLLLKSKFKDIQPKIRELLQVLVTVQRSTGASSNEFADALNLLLSPAQMIESLDETVLAHLQTHLEREHSFVTDMQQGESKIELSRCQTSTVKSNGDILIHKEGVLQSDLYSTGSITFGHPSSVCRGSCLEAEDRIDARTVGSAGGAPCILRARRTVYVYRMFEGKVSAGGLHRDVLTPVQDFTFGCLEEAGKT